MVKRARRVSLLFDPDVVRSLPEGFAEALGSHLSGHEVQAGDRIPLPGWPIATVEEVEPEGSRIQPGTELVIHVPPPPSEGALNLAFLVDASLTMGRSDEGTSPFREAARTIDAVLLNGRSFVATAGIVVQGGTTRQVDPLKPPEELAGPSILKVEPRGTFDLDDGIERCVDLLAEAPEGPRAILLVTDGRDGDADPLACAKPALRAGITVVSLTREPSDTIDGLCERTNGRAFHEPEPAFEFLANIVGAEGSWTEPEPVDPVEEEQPEFEVVIETMEEPV